MPVGVAFELLHGQESVHQLHDDGLLILGQLFDFLKPVEQGAAVQPRLGVVVGGAIDQEISGGAQRFGNAAQGVGRRQGFAGLVAADVRVMDVRSLGEFLLGQVALLAQVPQALGESGDGGVWHGAQCCG